MRIKWKGNFDGNVEHLPHGEHKPNAVKFKEIDNIKKLGLILNLLSVPLLAVTYAIVLLRGGFDVIVEHFYVYWAGILVALACLIPRHLLPERGVHLHQSEKRDAVRGCAGRYEQEPFRCDEPDAESGVRVCAVSAVSDFSAAGISGGTGSNFHPYGHRGLLQCHQCFDTDAQGRKNVPLWLPLLLVSAGKFK